VKNKEQKKELEISMDLIRKKLNKIDFKEHKEKEK